MKEATFQLTLSVTFIDNEKDELADQAWDVLRDILPMSLDFDGRLIGQIEDIS